MLFSFGVPDSLVRVLLSVCGIQTNYAVTFNQSVSFIRSLNGESHHDDSIKEWFSKQYIFIFIYIYSEKEDRIPINELVLLFSTSSVLLKPFKEIKDALIKNFINEKVYNMIGQRRLYYNTYNPNYSMLFPPEKCFDKFMREYVYKKPPPYYTEYRRLGEEENKSLDSLIIQVKIRYGYSRRMISTRNMYGHKSTLSSCSSNTDYDEGIRNISEHMKSGRSHKPSHDVIAGRKLSKEYVSKMNNDDHLKLLCSEASNHSLLIASRSKKNTKIHPEFSVHFSTDTN